MMCMLGTVIVRMEIWVKEWRLWISINLRTSVYVSDSNITLDESCLVNVGLQKETMVYWAWAPVVLGL